jgi:hypothetical protein
MAKKSGDNLQETPKSGASTALIIPGSGFDYARCDARVAETAREAAERIRRKIKTTLEDVIGIGEELLAIREALPHGQFGAWLEAEFGWTDRTARNFMAVAGQFGPKTEMISDMRIDPSAAYVLAAPAVPEEAREAALQRAAAGEHITPGVAREILLEARHQAAGGHKQVSSERVAQQLDKALQRCRELWDPKELAAMARQLRAFADLLDTSRSSGKDSCKD